MLLCCLRSETQILMTFGVFPRNNFLDGGFIFHWTVGAHFSLKAYTLMKRFSKNIIKRGYNYTCPPVRGKHGGCSSCNVKNVHINT